jgi:hypothetical protein
MKHWFSRKELLKIAHRLQAENLALSKFLCGVVAKYGTDRKIALTEQEVELDFKHHLTLQRGEPPYICIAEVKLINDNETYKQEEK